MIDMDKWQEIIVTLKKQKLRTGLTAFGVFWGIFILVILLGFGTGFGIKMQNSYGEGKNIQYLWAANKTQLAYKGFGKDRQITFTDEDVKAIKQGLPQIQLINGKNQLGAVYLSRANNSGSFNVEGSYAGWQAVEFLRVIEGRYFNEHDDANYRKVAVIGSRTKEMLFADGTNPIGKMIDIKGVNFLIIGIYQATYEDENNQQLNTAIYIPNNTLRQAFNQSTAFNYLHYQPTLDTTGEEINKKVQALVKERKNIHPDDKGVLGGYSMEEEYNKQQELVNGIIGFSWMVAIGTILAGVIGVGNIMLVVVKERTREIGLRKALGATPLNISMMIMHESLVITMVAGYSGLVAGVFVLEAIKKILITLGMNTGMFSSPYIDIGTALIALIVLIVCGVGAAVLPALKAASVNPIIALQDE